MYNVTFIARSMQRYVILLKLDLILKRIFFYPKNTNLITKMYAYGCQMRLVDNSTITNLRNFTR